MYGVHTNSRVTIGALLYVAVLLNGCAELESAMNKSLQKFGKKGNTTPATNALPADYRNVNATELYGLYEKNPQPGGGKVAQWPSVAITVIEVPNWGWKHLTQGAFQDSLDNHREGGCWKFRAKIWDSESQSRGVPVFYKCFPPETSINWHQDFEFVDWSGQFDQSALNSHTKSTGTTRTEGPIPPETVIPRTRAFQEEFTGSWTQKVIIEMMERMGVVYDTLERRIWVNFEPAAAPKRKE